MTTTEICHNHHGFIPISQVRIEDAFCEGVLPVWTGICPPDTPARKSWLQMGELWLYTSSSSMDKNLWRAESHTFTLFKPEPSAPRLRWEPFAFPYLGKCVRMRVRFSGGSLSFSCLACSSSCFLITVKTERSRVRPKICVVW